MEFCKILQLWSDKLPLLCQGTFAALNLFCPLYAQVILCKRGKKLFDSVIGIIMLVGWLLGKDILEMFTISVR